MYEKKKKRIFFFFYIRWKYFDIKIYDFGIDLKTKLGNGNRTEINYQCPPVDAADITVLQFVKRISGVSRVNSI